MKKLLALLIALLMILSVLASCKDKTTDASSESASEATSDTSSDTASDTDSDSESTSEVIPAETVTIFKKNEPAKYRLVYHDNLSKALKSKVEGLKYIASQTYRIDIEAVRLFANYEDSDVTEYEILIGDTAREESIAAKELLGDEENAFAIKLFENGKVVIVATNDTGLEKAIDYFQNTFITNNDTDELAIEKDYSYTEIFTITSKYTWAISEIPEYKGGMLNSRPYSQGTNRTMMTSGARLQVVSETDVTEFNQYLADLEAAGYTRNFYHTIAKNIYAQYYNGTKIVYAYLTATENEARIIFDKASMRLDQFNYTYEATENDTSAFYQYAIMHNARGQGGHDETTELLWENCGLFDIIKLADNSVVLLDGGWDPQATDTAVEECLKFLREITGTPEGEKVRIAAIYITHNHDDHMSFSAKLVAQHTEEIEVERLMHNLLPSASGKEFDQFGKSLLQNFPNSKFIQLHTGQKIQLANVTFEVLYTHEDLYTRTDLPKNNAYDQNNASTVLKMTMNGRTFLLTGDWSGGHQDRDKYEYKGMEASLLNSMKLDDGTSYLKCDVMQIPHHAINDWIRNLIQAVDPDVAFIPQQDVTFDELAYDCYKTNVNELRSIGVADEHILFAGRYTYGITVALDGTMTLTYRDIAGYSEEYKDIVLDAYEPFHEPTSGVLPF